MSSQLIVISVVAEIKHLFIYLRATGDPGMVPRAGSGFSLCLSPSPRYRRERQCGNNGLTLFPVSLDPLSPKQLCKDHPKKSLLHFLLCEMSFGVLYPVSAGLVFCFYAFPSVCILGGVCDYLHVLSLLCHLPFGYTSFLLSILCFSFCV